MKLSYGFIETKGLIGAIEAADAMVKAAKVQLIKRHQVGSGLVAVIVQGELAACQAAVDAGSAAAGRLGELITAHVIPNPFDDTENLVGRLLDQPKRQTAQKKHPRPKTKRLPAKQSAKDLPAQILETIAGQPDGITLKQLAAQLKQPPQDLRIMLKNLMDAGRIEKVQQKYFPTAQENNK